MTLITLGSERVKEGLRSRSATPLCFNGKVVQDHKAKSHRSVLPCVDRKRVFFGSESRQFTVRHQPPCSCGLVTMLEGPVACDVIFSTSQTPTRPICCTNSCATRSDSCHYLVTMRVIDLTLSLLSSKSTSPKF